MNGTQLRWVRAAALMLGFLAAGCGTTAVEIHGTRRMPGLDGRIWFEDASGSNRMVHMELEHLAPPERLESGSSYYAVWFRESNGRTSLAGRIDYNPDSRQGRMMATTPYSNFRVIVTIERQQTPTEPSSEVLVEQRLN